MVFFKPVVISTSSAMDALTSGSVLSTDPLRKAMVLECDLKLYYSQ